MKNKKILILTMGVILCSLFLVGCDENHNPANEKLFGDNSSFMPQVPISDQEFQIGIIQKISPITQDGYFLNSQAIAIKNGRVDRDNELPKIDIMVNNVQSVRDYVSELNVSENKKVNQEELIKALDKYSTQLTDYKNLLSNDSVSKENLQLKIDEVMSALELVKQFSK